MVSSLLTIPIYIRIVGDGRYGVLVVVWAFLGYFGLFDLGLGRATAQWVATQRLATPQAIATTFWTALAMNGALGAVGGLLIWPISNYFFGQAFSIDRELRSELTSALPWLILAVPMMTFSGVLTGALQGRAQFFELNVISVSTSVLLQILPLFVAWAHGPDLAWLLPAMILTRLISLVATLWRCKVHVFENHGPSFAREQAKGLLKFGGWVTVSSIVGPMMVILDRFVISATLGARAVTYYAVPFTMAQRSTILPGAVTSALFPRLAVAGGGEGSELAASAIRSLAAVMTPVMLIAVLLVEPFLRIWINPEFASNANGTAQILLLSWWINGFALIPFAQLQAAGRPDITAKFHLLQLSPYLLTLYAGLHFWGLPGAAAAFGLRNFADWAMLLCSARGLREGTRAIMVPFLILSLGVVIALGTAVGGATWWLGSLVLVPITLAWSWWSAPASTREWLGRPCRILRSTRARRSGE